MSETIKCSMQCLACKRVNAWPMVCITRRRRRRTQNYELCEECYSDVKARLLPSPTWADFERAVREVAEDRALGLAGYAST